LRCAGRDRAATIDDLMAFAANADPFSRLARLSRDWADRIEDDWQDFRASRLAKWAAKTVVPSRADREV
jgi:hypothetical protein